MALRAKRDGRTQNAKPGNTKSENRPRAESPTGPESSTEPDVPAAERKPTSFELSDAEVEDFLRTGDQPALMEDLFGPEGYTELRALARQAASRSVRGGERVLILPGIMGSRLGVRLLGAIPNIIWVSPADIALGRLAELELAADGSPGRIEPLGVISFAYMALKLRLRAAGYDADFAPFDWRRDIRALGADLATLIDGDGRDTHLVAHSMGGLVARAALASSPSKLRRVVTLGTPNFGSYSPVQAFRGVHSVVAKLDFLDRFHNQEELAAIFGTFRGLIQMMPSPRFRPEDLFSPGTWPTSGSRPADGMLAEARRAQEELPLPTRDWFQVIGVNNETVMRATVQDTAQGREFVYETSLDGDGTVPVDLARLKDFPAWVTTAAHGSISNSASVAKAVDSLLATGDTTELTRFDASLGGARARSAPRRTLTDRQLTGALPLEGQPGRVLSAREQRNLAADLVAPPGGPEDTPSAATPDPTRLGGNSGSVVLAGDSRFLTNFVVRRSAVRRVELDLVLGSITEVRADAYVVGLFRNVHPGGAFAAVDRELGGALGEIVSRKMVSGEAGEVASFPTGRHRFGAAAVLVAGLGSFERYSDDVLELAAENVTRTALLTRLDDFAIVPVGAASGSTVAGALHALLRGFVRALSSFSDGRLRGITLCETDETRFSELRIATMDLLRGGLFGDMEVVLNERRLPEVTTERRSPASPTGPEPVYLLVRQEVDQQGQASVVASVLTAGGKAAIVQARKELDIAALNTEAAKLTRNGLKAADADGFGAKLAVLALPGDTIDVLDRELSLDGVNRPLVVVHDAPMSRVPWEAILVKGKAPARQGGVIHRYDGGSLSVTKWSDDRAAARDLKVLLVIDPTEDLDGARKEGERIRKLLRARDIQFRELEGPQARKGELLRCFQSGEYDLVHYAGHAFFDPNHRAGSGILCHGHEVLSGGDLASLRQLPSLMFFNACESARVRRPGGLQAASNEPVRGTIGFAESFLAGGVANYLGTYWPVDDDAAEAFATEFYSMLLDGKTLGDAVLRGRQAVFGQGSGDWADYVLYGITSFRLAARRDGSPSQG